MIVNTQHGINPLGATVTFVVDGNIYEVQTLQKNTGVDAPAYTPVKSGYAFNYWCEDLSNPSAVVFPYRVNSNKTLYAYFTQGELEKTPVNFTAQQANSTVKLTNNGSFRTANTEYSLDNVTWNTYTFGTTIKLANIGDKVYFRNDMLDTPSSNQHIKFSMTGKLAGSGNCNSLVVSKGFENIFELPYKNCFISLFGGCSALTSSPALPATILTEACYQQMFLNCASLTTPPALPATTLATSCYNCMFMYCTSLTSVPELPVNTLFTGSYYGMFYACRSLQVSDTQTTEAPYAWTIPSSGTFANTITFNNTFANCAGTRASNNLVTTAGQSVTYYTQNEPISIYPVKGQLISIEGNQYRVLDISGSNAKVLSMFDASSSQTFGDNNTYAGSTLDTYLNTTWYGAQSATFQSAINDSSITTSTYQYYDEPNTPSTPTYTYQYQYNWSESDYENANRTATTSAITRKVFALDLKDIYDYFGKVCITSNELMTLFFNQTSAVSKYIWLRSAFTGYSNVAWNVGGDYGNLGYNYADFTCAARLAFTIDLSKITWAPVSTS